MLCPNCKNPLQKRTSKSEYGANLHLNRCEYCSGLWLEGLTLYQIPTREVKEIKKLTSVSRYIREELAGRFCPVCRVSLKSLHDPNLPANIHIKRCDQCGGSWTTPDELLAFKSYQSRKQLASKTLQFKQNLLKEQTISFLLILFITLMIPASIYLARRGSETVGEALVEEEINKISDVQVSNITSTTATIKWKTSLNSSSQIEYGTSEEYGLVVTIDLDFVIKHEVSLSDLQPKTLYHFRCISQDESGETSYSKNYTFHTLP